MNRRYLPNIITSVRIAVGVAEIILLFAHKDVRIINLWLLFFIAVTDFLDGYLARKLNAITEFGSFLDPLADKIVIIGILSFMYRIDIIEGWFFWAFIFRELVQTIYRARAIAATISGDVPTLFVSKAKTALCYLFCMLLMYVEMNPTVFGQTEYYYIKLTTEIIILVLAYSAWITYLFRK
jgi:CDP-diacylglycerol--glycerol-3-phosphate 3-phosphatidyltransferase